MTAPNPSPEFVPQQLWFRRVAFVMVPSGLALVSTLLWYHFHGKQNATPHDAPDSISATPFPEDVDQPRLRPELAAALGIEGVAAPTERLYLLHRISGQLSEHESDVAIAALLALPTDSVSPGWHAEYIHEICLMLRRSGTTAGPFARSLLSLAADSGRPVIIRDYALQHLASYWADPAAAASRDEITAALHDLVRSGPPVSAAALLALHRLGGTDAPPGTDRDTIPGVPDQTITTMVADAFNSMDTPTRMATVRIVGDRLLADQRDSLRAIATNENEPTVLRMAAVAAIARFSDPADATLIASIPTDEGGLLAGAIHHAIRVISPQAN